MAEAIIQLNIDPATQRKTIIIKYLSDADALPFEHEEEHREFVEKVLEKAGIPIEEIDNVVVKREGQGIKLELPEEENKAEPIANQS